MLCAKFDDIDAKVDAIDTKVDAALVVACFALLVAVVAIRYVASLAAGLETEAKDRATAAGGVLEDVVPRRVGRAGAGQFVV